VYQEELRRRLTERLGVEWGPDRNGCREMEGLDPRWLRTFSKRTAAIEEYLAGAGPENPDPVLRMRADEAASLATRPRKDGSLTSEVLRQRWQTEADGIGMPTGHALEAHVCDRTIPELRPRLQWGDVVDALIDPNHGLCARRARFNEAHVAEQVAALGAGRLTVGAIEDFGDLFLESDQAVLLVDRTGRSSPQYSTFDHLLPEGRVLELLDDLSITPVDGIDSAIVERAIAAEKPGLGFDQAGAVRTLCAPGPAIRSVIAPAGFGKTTTVHAAAIAARSAGHPVIGLAATNQAAGELRQAGIPATTIARFALDGATLPAGAVVVLDEVSQVATSDAEIVLSAVAETSDASLWCLGDPHQSQAVRAGGLGAELARLGASGEIPAPELTENRRQLEPAERQALARYRAGLVATSQAIRKGNGWEHDLGSPHATREALQAAEERLGELGPLSQLRRHGRKERTSVLDRIDRFTDDVRQAEAKITRCQDNLEEVRSEVDQRPRWDAEHRWPDERLHAVDAELAELAQRGQHIEPGRRTHLSDRRLGREQQWLDRPADVALPPLPGRDLGHGIDLGL
jgi:hypothetical protein